MSSGRQAGGDRWVSYSDCDKHICTEGGSCGVCELERLTARIAELEAENEMLVRDRGTLPDALKDTEVKT